MEKTVLSNLLVFFLFCILVTIKVDKLVFFYLRSFETK
jgi:hypothetical protein